jgi:hypothetical protein
MKFSIEEEWLEEVWRCKRKLNYGMQNLEPILLIIFLILGKLGLKSVTNGTIFLFLDL